MSRLRACLVASALAAAAPGCDLAPDVGPPTEYRCVDDDTNAAVSVSWSRDVAPIILRNQVGCARCHDPARSNPVGVQIGGLDLTSRGAALAGGARSGASIVVPGAPCSSALYQKLLAGPPFGARMPLDGPPYLSATELNLFHDWIAEGAQDN